MPPWPASADGIARGECIAKVLLVVTWSSAWDMTGAPISSMAACGRVTRKETEHMHAIRGFNRCLFRQALYS